MTKPKTKIPPDEAVGYGRPPKSTQFAPGKSGNPRGRPKGSTNLTTAIDKELKRKIPVTVNGVRKSISKVDAAARQFTNKAASGDPKAINALLAREKGRGVNDPESNSRMPYALDAIDEAALKTIFERVRMIATSTEEIPTPTPRKRLRVFTQEPSNSQPET